MSKRSSWQHDEEAKQHDRWECGRGKQRRPDAEADRSGSQRVCSCADQTRASRPTTPSCKAERTVKVRK